MIRLGVDHEGPTTVLAARDDETGRSFILTFRRAAYARAVSDLLAGRARDPDEDAESACSIEGSLEVK